MSRRPTVIKAAAVVQTERFKLSSFRLDDVMREARESIAAAHAQARGEIEEAEKEAAGIRAAAHDSGYKAGFDEGREIGQQSGRAEAFDAARTEFAEQQRSLIASYQQAIAAIDAGRNAWQAAARQDLIDLAMAIARRVVHHVGEREREAVLANLEEAVRLAGVRSDVTIAVNSVDADAAGMFIQSLTDLQEQWKNVRIVQEPEVSPGGCRVQWGSGAIDATLETQLDRIEAALRNQSGEGERGRVGDEYIH